jgi:hypothetical protein
LITTTRLDPSELVLIKMRLIHPFPPISNRDLDPSLKLRIFAAEKKGIRGGDAELHFQSASRPGNLLVGRRSRHLFGSL